MQSRDRFYVYEKILIFVFTVVTTEFTSIERLEEKFTQKKQNIVISVRAWIVENCTDNRRKASFKKHLFESGDFKMDLSRHRFSWPITYFLYTTMWSSQKYEQNCRALRVRKGRKYAQSLKQWALYTSRGNTVNCCTASQTHVISKAVIVRRNVLRM